jgi:hypothetical protein
MWLPVDGSDAPKVKVIVDFEILIVFSISFLILANT